ncbi:MAG: phosphodiester glycosidase family protein [bacterium]
MSIRIGSVRLTCLILIIILLFSSPIVYSQEIYDQILVAPGLNYSIYKDSSPIIIHTLELDPTSPYVLLETVLASDSLFNREVLSSMVNRTNAIAGINGDFFDPPTGMIINLMVRNGELIRLPINRGVFAITKDNQPVISSFTCSIGIDTTLGSIPLTGLNIPRGGDDAVLFTKVFGNNTTISNKAFAGIDVELLNLSRPLPPNGTITATVGNIYYGAIRSPIPDRGGILSLGGKAISYFPYIRQGDTVKITTRLNPSLDIVQAVGGGTILLKDGEIVFGKTGEDPLPPGVTQQQNPLTIIALDGNGKIDMIVIDGRSQQSKGMTYLEVANYLKNLGMKDAITLDGGGSSEMIIKNNIVNNPSDGKERAIANGIVLKASLSSDKPVLFSIHPKKATIKEGENLKIAPMLQDIYGNIFPIDLDKIKWTLDGVNGILNRDAVFYPLSSGSGKIKAQLDNLQAELEINITPNKRNQTVLEDFENNPIISISGSGFDLEKTKISLSNSNYVGGKTSLKLDYSLLTGMPSYIYISFNYSLPKNSKKLGLWVYGDRSGHWLRAMFRDSQGNIWVGNFTDAPKGISWEGWKYLELDLSSLEILSGDKSQKITPPLELLQIYMVELKEERKNQGCIYLDTLQVF